MLGRRKRPKRRLEDDLPSSSCSPNNLEWQRRLEGFTDNENQRRETGISKRLCTQRAHSAHRFLESSFEVSEQASDASEPNVSEDVELISWSSSDGETERPENLKTTKIKTNTASQNGPPAKKTKSPSVTRPKPKTQKANKLELHCLSPSFDCLQQEAEEDIDNIQSDDEPEEKSPNSQKPSTRVADLPRLVSPIKKSKNNHISFQDSPAICSFQSGHSASSESPSTSGLKASDWVKAMDWQTPVKSGSQDESEFGPEPDSAKKKRVKYIKGGLAEKLNKLQARERTALRIWDHHQNDEENASKACLVKVMHFEFLYSLQIAHCKVARINQINQSEDGQENTMDMEGGDWKSQVVLFSKHMMEKLKIQAGSLVKIYPPWEELELPSLGKTVLLCTNYSRVVSPSVSVKDTSKMTDETKVVLSAHWSCPCSRDPAISSDDCSVKNIPFHPSSCQFSSQQCVPDPGISSTNTLHTVSVSQQSLPLVCQSLLEAIQKAGAERSLNFRAVVQRVFCNSAGSYSLLVEDSHGTMAIVQLNDDTERLMMRDCEGKTCMLAGLTVVTRSNRERKLALFSVMEKAWSGHMASASSQESQEDEPDLSRPACISCPGFCYILAPSGNGLFSMAVSQEQSTSYRQPQLSPLVDVKRVHSDRRISFMARILHKRMDKDPQRAGGTYPVWYVTDKSLACNYLIIKGTSDCNNPTLSESTAVFTDVYLVNGQFQADCYTRIRAELPSFVEDEEDVREEYQQLKELKVTPAPLTSCVQPWELVSVHCEITSVDEEAAYSWEECDGCGSDRLTEDTHNTGVSTCVSCQRRVTSPVIRMKMEVYVRCPDLETRNQIKIDLLQSTVEKLLPQQTEDDEGYDIDSVLNKKLGPLPCLVTSVKTKEDETEIKLQEIT